MREVYYDWHGDGYRMTCPEQKNPDFVFRGRFAFPKSMSCGNYKTPDESPYGYGPHVVQGPIKKFEGPEYNADYDDRLRQFYPERWEAACKMLSGRRFDHATMKSLSAFLSELYQKPVKCVQVVKGCNVSNGYPYWIFISKNARPDNAATGAA